MTSEKKAKWIYWAVTAPLVVTMMLAGLMLLAGVTSNVEGITHLGYPKYIVRVNLSETAPQPQINVCVLVDMDGKNGTTR